MAGRTRQCRVCIASPTFNAQDRPFLLEEGPVRRWQAQQGIRAACARSAPTLRAWVSRPCYCLSESPLLRLLFDVDIPLEHQPVPRVRGAIPSMYPLRFQLPGSDPGVVIRICRRCAWSNTAMVFPSAGAGISELQWWLLGNPRRDRIEKHDDHDDLRGTRLRTA